MNRKLKFRVWDKHKKTFIDSDVYAVINRTAFGAFGVMIKDWEDYKEGEFFYDEAQELAQFTGLKDKNGKEIYADDILFDGEHKFRVYAMYGGFGIKAPHWSGIMEDMVMGDDLIMQPLADAQTMSYISQSMEVIGNIYEHNHLLR